MIISEHDSAISSKQNRLTSVIKLAVTLILSLSAFTVCHRALAARFLGFGQPGPYGKFTEQNYFTVNQTEPSNNSLYNTFELSYFTPYGLTGTKRDQFEFWGSVTGGYANTHGSSDEAWGYSAPTLGAEYYYRLIEPSTARGAEGYKNWWITPEIYLGFPNGNNEAAGFGAGSNHYTLNFDIDNFFQFGRFVATVDPVEMSYAFQNQNATKPIPPNSVRKHERGGLSLTLMDSSYGYQFTKTIMAGMHTQFSINHIANSDFQKSERGTLGPAVSYSGLGKYGIYINGVFDVDYYTHDVSHARTLYLWISKTL